MRIRVLFTSLLMIALSTNASAKLSVVCTLSDYCALAKAVGGEHVKVQSFAKVGEDPHYVDPKPSFIIKLHQADLLISNGLELEIGWLPTLVLQARNRSVQKGEPGRLIAGDVIDTILEVPTTKVDRSQGDVHPSGNPHLNHDPARMAVLTPVIAQYLSRLSPKNEAVFMANARTVAGELEALIAKSKQRFAALPTVKKQVVTYHKSLSYLLDSLGLKAAMYVEPKPGVAPTPRHTARVLSTMKRNAIPIIVQESHYPQKTSSTLAKIARARLVVIPGGTRSNQTYLENAQATIDSIYAGLSGGGSR